LQSTATLLEKGKVTFFPFSFKQVLTGISTQKNANKFAYVKMNKKNMGFLPKLHIMILVGKKTDNLRRTILVRKLHVIVGPGLSE